MGIGRVKATIFTLVSLLLVASLFTGGCKSAQVGEIEDEGYETEKWSDMKLWYRQPAEQWIEALPIGNGRLGAMVFGKTENERIQLNEDTIWTGGPYEPSVPEGPEALPEIRRLIFEGKYRKAEAILGRIMQTYPRGHMKYQPLGDLWLNSPGHGEVTDYHRQLDLDTAIVRVSYRVDDANFTREVFSSPVDQVIVVRLTADKPGKISFTARISGMKNTRRPGDETFTSEGMEPDSLVLKGKTASYPGIEGRVKYQARVKAFAEGGKITIQDGSLNITGADAATLLIPAATNFVNYKDISADPEARVKQVLSRVSNKPYNLLRKDHVAEHRRLFRRVRLDLDTTRASRLPTDERLRKFRKGKDPQLAALYFQFGRYLLISSSRPGSQPPNLQGIWNESLNPSWGSKYTTNINLEMNYWPAEVTNLSECVEPLVRMITGLAETGSRTAKLHYGARGWVHHYNTDIWLPTAPMGGGYFASWHTAGGWFCTHLWEHYLFNGDKVYLKEVYPIIKGAAQFFLDTLVEHPKYYWLVTSPSHSPENWYKIQGNNGPWSDNTSICAGASMDMQIVRDLFDIGIKASQILDLDNEFRGKLRQTVRRLATMQIGKHGQLQEWLEDWDDPEHKHRHLSHLYGLYPSNQITLRGTPEFAQAAKQSLIFRGDKNSGWSRAWKIGLWARLEDGEHAYKIIRNTLDLQEKLELQHDDEGYWKGGTYPNMFSSGPPMQVDGNFGGCSGIAEMLLHSHAEEIHLLPALPKAWASGSLEGLCARGGFEVDISWKDGKLTSARLFSKLSGKCRIRAHAPLQVSFEGKSTKTAHPVEMVPYGLIKGTVKKTFLTEFETETGREYVISIRE